MSQTCTEAEAAKAKALALLPEQAAVMREEVLTAVDVLFVLVGELDRDLAKGRHPDDLHRHPRMIGWVLGCVADGQDRIAELLPALGIDPLEE